MLSAKAIETPDVYVSAEEDKKTVQKTNQKTVKSI